MIFENPFHFFWLILALTAAGSAWRNRRFQKRALAQWAEPLLLEKIFPYAAWKRNSLRRTALEFFGIILLILSLAGPQVGQKMREIKMKSNSLFILVDSSDSMLAEDFKPNRMEKAKRLLTGILEKCSGQKIGIIAFAGEAYVYCPLTFDQAAVKQFLKSIEPGMIPQPGTRIGSAVRLALNKFGGGTGSNAVILLSDGEDHRSDPLGAAEEAKKNGVTLFTIGIGNPDGEPIPARDAGGNLAGYKKDRKGEVVLSRLGESALAEMALLTGGSYFRASESEQEIDLLLEKLSELEKGSAIRKKETYENRYQWPLAASALLFLLSDSLSFIVLKRAAALLLLMGLMNGSSIRAESFEESLRKGNKLYREEKYGQALKNYEKAGQKNPADPRANFNKGAALYRLQEMDRSSEEFKKGTLGKDPELAAKSYFNLGNSQFRKGDYAGAARSYQQSLKLDPRDRDAKYNLQLALQLKKVSPQTKKENRPEEQKEGQPGRAEAEEQKREKEEAAKRILKNISETQGDKPVFKPQSKKGPKKENEEDW